MFTTITSGAILGILSRLVQVEVDTAQGLPGFELVGSPGGEVREARERVKVALKNAGIRIPAVRITVNLSPADIRKEGTGYDLPIAAGILVSLKLVPGKAAENTLFLGELGLGGEVKKVPGVLPIVLEAMDRGLRSCVVPKENKKEAEAAGMPQVVGISKITELVDYLRGVWPDGDICVEKEKSNSRKRKHKQNVMGDFADIGGQQEAKRALEIAAAGFHHVLLAGPPGAGKTMLAERLPTILPPMSNKESLEVSKIYSVAGLLGENSGLVTERPFLNPHHTTSAYAITGGGHVPRPGAVSLAHRGILFLDELPEFKKEALEALRQPLQSRQTEIVRNGISCIYPADFMLVAAMNPCPCGYYPDRNKCRCTPGEVRRYLNRVSGPILDRIDIVMQVPRPELKELKEMTVGSGESSTKIRERVMEARERQTYRYRDCEYRFNSDLRAGDIHTYCRLGAAEEQFLTKLFSQMDFSARGYHKILKLARTIADLSGRETITKEHLSEAACLKLSGLPELT